MIEYKTITVERGVRSICMEEGYEWYSGNDVNYAYQRAEFIGNLCKACGCGCVIEVKET